MLTKRHRLAKQDELKKIFYKGKKEKNDFFSICYLANRLANPRFAVVVANKTSKRATERNRIKRQIRAIIKTELAKIRVNNDIIINAFGPTVNQKQAKLSQKLLELLEKMR